MKKIPYGHQYIDSDDVKAVVGSLKSDWLTMGPQVKEFEDALASYTGAKYAVAVSSGTAALHLSVMALGIKKSDRVITTPNTFCASANCFLFTGAKPIFIDINDTSYHMDIEKLEDYIKNSSKRKLVKAVVPVHFMGMVIDIERIRKLCRKYGIKIVEDAAHAIGASYRANNKCFKVGSSKHSDITIFSFHPIKNMTTGEGGAILTNNKKIYESVLKLRHHGIIRKGTALWDYDIPRIGYNYRITSFQCALGLSQLKKLDRMVEARRKIANFYNKHFSMINDIRLPHAREGSRASHNLYVIRVPKTKREKLYKHLRKNNIFTQVNYLPVHLFSYYRKSFGYKKRDFPVSESYSKECLSLPMYAGLRKTDQLRVVNAVKEFFNNKKDKN